MPECIKAQLPLVDEWQTCFRINDSILRNPLTGVDGNTYADWDAYVNSLPLGADNYPHLPSPNHHNGVLLPFGKLGMNSGFTVPRLSPTSGLRFIRPVTQAGFNAPEIRALMFVASEDGDGVCHHNTSLANDGRYFRQLQNYRVTTDIDFRLPEADHLATGGYLWWEQYHGAAVGPNWQGISNPTMALFVFDGRFKLQRYGSTHPNTANPRFYNYLNGTFISTPSTSQAPLIDLGAFVGGPQTWVVTRTPDFTGVNAHFRVERNGVMLWEDFETNGVDWSSSADHQAGEISAFGQYFLGGNPNAIVDFIDLHEERRTVAV